MNATTHISESHLRLLECWLPLAQATSQICGWGVDAASLQALVLAAAPALVHAKNAVEARAILIIYYARQRSESR